MYSTRRAPSRSTRREPLSRLAQNVPSLRIMSIKRKNEQPVQQPIIRYVTSTTAHSFIHSAVNTGSLKFHIRLFQFLPPSALAKQSKKVPWTKETHYEPVQFFLSVQLITKSFNWFVQCSFKCITYIPSLSPAKPVGILEWTDWTH